MTDFLKADIFFFITTIAVVVVSAGVGVALVYIIRILRDLKSLSSKIKEEGEDIIGDVHHIRKSLSFFGFGSKSRKSHTKSDE